MADTRPIKKSIVINGRRLHEVMNGQDFPAEIDNIYSAIASPHHSLRGCLVKAIGKLRPHQGMPPSSDPYVMSNIVEPALQCIPQLRDKSIDRERFCIEFKKVAEHLVQNLAKLPVKIIHHETMLNGRKIEELLNNRARLSSVLHSTMNGFPNVENKERNFSIKYLNKTISNAYLDYALREIASYLDLPSTEEFDKVINDVYSNYPTHMVNPLTMNEKDRRMLPRDDFKKELTQLLRRLAHELNRNPILDERFYVEPLNASK